MNKFKCISHAERMNNCNLHYNYDECLTANAEIYKRTNVEKYGRVVNELVSTTVDPRDNFQGFKVSDFSIENMQALGTDMNYVQLEGSPMSSIDNAVAVLDGLEIK